MASSLGKILDDATRRELVTNHEVAACRDELRARGRRRTTVIDELMRARGIDFDPLDSNAELRLRTWLEDAGLHPVPQFPVIASGKRRVLDFAFPDERVAAEYYGMDWHALEDGVVEDSDRTTELQLAGWLVVIITKRTGRKRAVAMVKEALNQRRRGLA